MRYANCEGRRRESRIIQSDVRVASVPGVTRCATAVEREGQPASRRRGPWATGRCRAESPSANRPETKGVSKLRSLHLQGHKGHTDNRLHNNIFKPKGNNTNVMLGGA